MNKSPKAEPELLEVEISPVKEDEQSQDYTEKYDETPVKEEEDKVLAVSPNEQKSSNYVFSIFRGNYGESVRQQIMKRGNWKEVGNESAISKSNFIWKPFSFSEMEYRKIKLKD